MPRTVSDADWNTLISKKAIADFIEPIYNDPKWGKEARALIKKAYPNVQIEGYDLEQKFSGELQELRNELAEKEKKKSESEEESKILAQRKRVQDEYKFTDDGMKDLEGFMREKNVGDYEVAAGYKAAKTPRASDPTSGSSRRLWEHAKSDSFSEISKDPEKWGFNQLVEAAERDAARARNQEF